MDQYSNAFNRKSIVKCTVIMFKTKLLKSKMVVINHQNAVPVRSQRVFNSKAQNTNL
jgi:hypothetical protein